ncbi:MAG: class I SAM-dependent methyltransferase [bacterium]|nr:class I SAM-dependent methyltransferase [bacterium]
MEEQVTKRYDKKENDFSERTFIDNVEEIQKRFIHMLPENAVIMDLGCGSGRNTLYFKNHGLTVLPVEGSRVLCNIAAKHTGLKVRHMRVLELNEVNRFDGIWASSSFIHLSYEEIIDVLHKVFRALKPGGVLYMAFRYGTFEGARGGRQCIDLDERKFIALLRQVKGFEVEWKTVTPDIRPECKQQWMNIFLRKIK